MKRFIVFFSIISLVMTVFLTGCQPQIPSEIVTSGNPPDLSHSPYESSGSYITILPRDVQLLKSPSGGEGNFRLLVVVADEQGHSGGMFCPGTNTILIRNGDTLSPCQTAISFPAELPGNKLYVLFVGVNEKKNSEMVDVGAGVLSNLIAKGLITAIGIGTSSVGGFIAGLTIETIIGYAGSKAADWFQEREILGSQTYMLERNQNWYAGQFLQSESKESGMTFSFTVELSSSAKGEVVQSSGINSSTATTVYIAPTEVATPIPVQAEVLPDPEEGLRIYYQALNQTEYERAWNLLTDSFKAKNNSSGFGPYRDWFQTISETRIITVSVDHNQGDYATLTAELSYYFSDGRVDTYDLNQFEMVFDHSRNEWMIDDAQLLRGSR